MTVSTYHEFYIGVDMIARMDGLSILLILSLLTGTALIAQEIPSVEFAGAKLVPQEIATVELGIAKRGALWVYALRTDHPATFKKLDDGNSNWLRVSSDGVLMGIPGDTATQKTVVAVTASWKDKIIIRRFVIRVASSTCAPRQQNDIAWCDDESRRPPSGAQFTFAPDDEQQNTRTDPFCKDSGNGCIVQFDRLDGDFGAFGHFQNGIPNVRMDKLDPTQSFRLISQPAEQTPTWSDVTNAINGSSVFLSGSVLIRTAVTDCPFWSWSLVAETIDSSNNLFYGPGDLSVFCTKDNTLLIVLPVHAIWASVYGTPANANNPTWKPAPAPPNSHECWSGTTSTGLPTQGIRPCDARADPPSDPQIDYSDEAPGKYLRKILYSHVVEWTRNRETQPGVSQGSISITPIAPATKATWDVQGYGSTLLGPGWIGLQLMYEHDRKPADDLNSLTAALTYDYRFFQHQRYWLAVGTGKSRPGHDEHAAPPIIGVRPLEWAGRVGPEWSPSAEMVKGPFGPALASGTGFATETLYLPRDLNVVAASTLRLPIVLSPIRYGGGRQPSQITLVPVLGVEWGARSTSHPIGPNCPDEPKEAGTLCAPQPQEILRRVLGADASLRIPYNFTRNFLGDRPITLDFSYRARRLYYSEPFFNESSILRDPAQKALPEDQYEGSRSYTRITFIAPFSAYLQFRATWQHGSLPPVFQYVGNEVTLGLAFSNPGLSEH